MTELALESPLDRPLRTAPSQNEPENDTSMLFFIPWVVFLLLLIVSVIVAHVMSNRGRRPSGTDAAAMMPEDYSVDEPLMEAGEGEFAEPAIEEFASAEPSDDFAAFEQEFK